MIYLQKSRPTRGKSFWLILIVSVLLVLSVLSIQVFAGGFIERIAMATGGPVALFYSSVKSRITYVGSLMQTRASLVQQNKELKATIENNAAAQIRFDSLVSDHADLLAHYSRSFSTDVVLGNIISKPPQSPYDIIVADVGSRDGVVVGSRVHGLGDIPLGRVSDVSANTSKIVMFSSPGEENQVIHERTGATISVKGTGGGNIEAEVAQEMDITIGDKVLLPQFGGAVAASVVDVESNVTSAFKLIILKAPINIFHLRWVEVAKIPQDVQ